jgi:hypothetical protein
LPTSPRDCPRENVNRFLVPTTTICYSLLKPMFPAPILASAAYLSLSLPAMATKNHTYKTKHVPYLSHTGQAFSLLFIVRRVVVVPCSCLPRDNVLTMLIFLTKKWQTAQDVYRFCPVLPKLPTLRHKSYTCYRLLADPLPPKFPLAYALFTACLPTIYTSQLPYPLLQSLAP